MDRPVSIVAAGAAVVVGVIASGAGARRSRPAAGLTFGGLGLALLCTVVWVRWVLGAD